MGMVKILVPTCENAMPWGFKGRPALVVIAAALCFAVTSTFSGSVRADSTLQGRIDVVGQRSIATTTIPMGESFYLKATIENLGNATTPPLAIQLWLIGPFQYGNPPRPPPQGMKAWEITWSLEPGHEKRLSRGDWYETSKPITLEDGSLAEWGAGGYTAEFEWSPANSSDNRLEFIGRMESNFSLVPVPTSIDWTAVWLVAGITAAVIVTVALIRRRRTGGPRKSEKEGPKGSRKKRKR